MDAPRVALLLLALLGTAAAQAFPKIQWSFGPHRLALGSEAELNLPQGLIFAQGAQLRLFLKASGNAITGKELAVAGPADLRWFVVISEAPGVEGGKSWTEQSREADGRQVVIRSAVAAVEHEAFLFELVSEAAQADAAKLEFENLLRGFGARAPAVERWALGLAALLVAGVAAYAIRQRGL